MMDYLKRAREVIDIEIEGLEKLKTLIDGDFVKAVDLILETVANGGKIVITGVGKNIHVGAKMAATLTSVGTPACVMHAIEAMHGDFGMLAPADVVMAMSYSGASNELTDLLPAIKRCGNKIIGLTGVMDSPLADHCDLLLPITVDREACPFGMAPTTSTTVTMALGDALAMVLIDAQGFKLEDYAKRHPGGAIGRTLLLKVKDIMRTGDRLAKVTVGSLVKDAVAAMTRAKSGCVAIVTEANSLVGIFTDGDLRRHLISSPNILEMSVDSIMTANPVSLNYDQLAVDILKIYEDRNIDDLIVLDDDGRVVGSVDIVDLPKMKII
jgi:arabinose-5-phosphate isomerase